MKSSHIKVKLDLSLMDIGFLATILKNKADTLEDGVFKLKVKRLETFFTDLELMERGKK